MNMIRKVGGLILVLLMVFAMTIPGFAATKKAIKAVSISVSGKVTAGTEIGDESISVTSGGTGYKLDHYEPATAAFSWESGVAPEIIVYLKANDNYYFNIQKASQITLSGCTYKTASRQDSATTLAVQLVLPKVGLAIDPVEETVYTAKGLCCWSKVANAGSYEIRLMRDSTILGGTKTVTGEDVVMQNYNGEKVEALCYDGMQFITKGGTYHFRVRAIHKDDNTVKSDWTDSEDVTLDDEEARAIAAEYESIQSAGEWITDAGGTKFRRPDGTFLAGTWKRIHGDWYYFQPSGYIAKGWIQLDGAWYYLDPTTGVMWKNTTTPDGYNLAIDGRRY